MDPSWALQNESANMADLRRYEHENHVITPCTTSSSRHNCVVRDNKTSGCSISTVKKKKKAARTAKLGRGFLHGNDLTLSA